jgi:hypothetical protein
MQQRRRPSFHMHRLLPFLVLHSLLFARPAFAQEDVEPRTVGGRGVSALGLSAFIDRYASTESTFPTLLTLQVDVSRFVTTRIALRGGLIGSAALGADADDVRSGPGGAAIDARGAALYYFTPQSIASAYAGVEYRAPLTTRVDGETGSALGLAGVEASLSSRASVFAQGGYGMRLTRGGEGERQWRITGDLGVRIRF